MPRRQTVWRQVEIVQWPRTMLAGSVGCCPEEKTPFESLPLFWFWVLAWITGAAHSSYQYSLFHLYSRNEQELDLPYPETLVPSVVLENWELWILWSEGRIRSCFLRGGTMTRLELYSIQKRIFFVMFQKFFFYARRWRRGPGSTDFWKA